MRVKDIMKKAKSSGIKEGIKKKVDLIRAIQKKEGNFECFGTAKDYCDQANCCWRNDCLNKYY